MRAAITRGRTLLAIIEREYQTGVGALDRLSVAPLGRLAFRDLCVRDCGRSLDGHAPQAQPVLRLWTDEALRSWALPIAGGKATPRFYTEAEYYATPVDEVRTYPFYLKSREPQGYREWMRKRRPQPLVDPAALRTEADWIAAGARSLRRHGSHRLPPIMPRTSRVAFAYSTER